MESSRSCALQRGQVAGSSRPLHSTGTSGNRRDASISLKLSELCAKSQGGQCSLRDWTAIVHEFSSVRFTIEYLSGENHQINMKRSIGTMHLSERSARAGQVSRRPNRSSISATMGEKDRLLSAQGSRPHQVTLWSDWSMGEKGADR
jgi:hypothetical protein